MPYGPSVATKHVNAAVRTQTSSGDAAAPAPTTASEPMRVGGDVKAPKVTKRVDVEYPSVSADRKYVLGVLVLEAVIDKTGAIKDITIVKGPHDANSQAVIDALQKWHFAPGTLHGKPIDVVFNLTVGHFPMAVAPN